MKKEKTIKNKPLGANREYFTQEILDSVNGMSQNEMMELLKGIESTRVWIAIIKYTQERLSLAQSMLCSIDPFKDPTSLARQQGIMQGLSDLQNVIIILNTKHQESDEIN